MSQGYFSDREGGPRPRVVEEIPTNVWGGIIAIVSRMIGDASFGYSFPKLCNVGPVCGCDNDLLIYRLKAEIPDIVWPLTVDKVPRLFTILDFIEFCYKYAAKPKIIEFHSFEKRNRFNNLWGMGKFAEDLGIEPSPGHNHYSFDVEQGREEFREAITLIFSRNEIIYELTESGTVIRIGPEVLRELLQQTKSHTGDSALDDLLDTAHEKYRNRDLKIRKESLEKLWDAWERLKTIEPGDKKVSITTLLKKTSPETNFYNRLDGEAKELTEIGNQFNIRHHEINKIPIESSDHVDYLFFRMFSLIYLILKSTNRIK